MAEGKIAVRLNASSLPSGGFGICAELYLTYANASHPRGDKTIARRETESLEYMSLGFGSPTQKNILPNQSGHGHRLHCDQALTLPHIP